MTNPQWFVSAVPNDWAPYIPPDYPIQDDPCHNPWVVIDPISGMTAYRLWLQLRECPGVKETGCTGNKCRTCNGTGKVTLTPHTFLRALNAVKNGG